MFWRGLLIIILRGDFPIFSFVKQSNWHMGHPNANCSTANVAMHEAFFWSVCSVCVGGLHLGAWRAGLGFIRVMKILPLGKRYQY